MRISSKASVVLVALSTALPAAAGEVFVPGSKVHPEDITALKAADAKLPPGMQRGQEVIHGKFPVAGRGGPVGSIEWEAEASAAERSLTARIGRTSRGGERS